MDKGIPGLEALQRLVDALLNEYPDDDSNAAIMEDYNTVDNVLRGLTSPTETD
jgi:hypothetical protein